MILFTKLIFDIFRSSTPIVTTIKTFRPILFLQSVVVAWCRIRWGRDGNRWVLYFSKNKVKDCCRKIPEKRKASILRILRFARNEYKFLIPGLLTTLLRGCSWPIFSIVYGRLFKSLSDVLIDKSGVMTVERFAEFIVLGLVAGTLTFSSGFLLGTSGEKLTKRMRYLLFGVSCFGRS